MASGFDEENLLFIAPGRAESVRRKDFSGFKSDEGLSSDFILRKRVIDLEAQVRELFERLKVSDHNYEVLRAENTVLRNDYDCLRKQMHQEQSLIKEMDDKQSVWRKEQQKEQESFKKIMENQIKEENVTKTIVKVIKKSENLVRDTVEKKKSVIVFGIAEDNIPVR